MKFQKIYLILMTFVDTLIICASLIMAMFAPMMFDAPGSENSLLVNSLFYIVVCFPLLSIGAVGYAWYISGKEKIKMSLIVITLPLILTGIFIGIFTLLDIFCNGNLTCNA